MPVPAEVQDAFLNTRVLREVLDARNTMVMRAIVKLPLDGVFIIGMLALKVWCKEL